MNGLKPNPARAVVAGSMSVAAVAVEGAAHGAAAAAVAVQPGSFPAPYGQPAAAAVAQPYGHPPAAAVAQPYGHPPAGAVAQPYGQPAAAAVASAPPPPAHLPAAQSSINVQVFLPSLCPPNMARYTVLHYFIKTD